MNTFLQCSVLAIAAISQGAIAQTSGVATDMMLPDSQVVAVPAHSHRIEVPARPHYMMRIDFEKFAGEYELSNGDTLQLWRRSGLMYARIGQQAELRIVATSRNAFVALNRQMKVRIDRHDDGSVSGEMVVMVPSQQLADGTISGERFATTSIYTPHK